MKKWVHKTDLLEIRPAVDGEMVAPGQFSKRGDMIVTHAWPSDDFLVAEKDSKDYIEVEVTDQANLQATMTCNQIMVLLDIYRGTFCADRHVGTVEQDLAHLFRSGLIDDCTILGVCTDAGTRLVDRILKMQ